MSDYAEDDYVDLDPTDLDPTDLDPTDLDPTATDFGEPTDESAATETVPTAEADDAPPAPAHQLTFGASIGPYGETADSYAEEYNYSTTTDSYIGAQSGREIDPWTGTEKK
jgi:hypothetical protein